MTPVSIDQFDDPGPDQAFASVVPVVAPAVPAQMPPQRVRLAPRDEFRRSMILGSVAGSVVFGLPRGLMSLIGSRPVSWTHVERCWLAATSGPFSVFTVIDGLDLAVIGGVASCIAAIVYAARMTVDEYVS